MRSLLFTVFFSLFGTLLFSQPSNDDCEDLIDLGILPGCPTDIFTNIDATASDIGFGNSPSCFNGGTAQNDVWFAFTTNDTLIDINIQLFGVTDGPNGQSIGNPQIALYRGACEVDGLAELACFSSPNGSSQISADVLGLTPNTMYFLRINDYSATAAPNWGDFTLCVDEYIPDINMGDEDGSTSCFGTLYDSGGPDEDYSSGENLTFTICPNQFHDCIELNLESFAIEQGFDNLRVYAGEDISAPLVATATGVDNGNGFPIQVSSDCVTIEFTSDGSVTDAGFELTWSCTATACQGTTPDNPTTIPGIPFSQSDISTCDGAATFAESPCNNAPFLSGPEYVFAYDSPGGLCAQISVTGAELNTGVLVLNGLPGDPGTVCVAQSTSGLIGAANLQDAGTYYIVVANAQGCTDFNINIEESECSLEPSLVDALCNPLNGCIEDGGVPSIFNFENGFQDIELLDGVNEGCWLGVGFEPDFIWFTIEAQADGPFGFILESADNPSDIDFSVWGPFTNEDVCENPADVISFIENNQPIRSSWSGGADPTGLADIHPVFGYPVEDEFDCGSPATPGAGGDDFVSTIQCTQGEVYVVLVNDWGDAIGDAGISVDWGPSEPAVLAPIPVDVLGGDTTVCMGESVQILIADNLSSIEWIDETGTLSCTDCFDPIATPMETTSYKAVVDAICYSDTVEVNVVVYSVDAGPDLTVCLGEEIQIVAGASHDVGSYAWDVPTGLNFSCTDCPDPLIIADAPGTYNLAVILNTPNCDLQDAMVLEVLAQEAPVYEVSDDVQVCAGTTVSLGGDATPGVTYSWTSIPEGFTSDEANPQVTPTETTQYLLSIENGLCPFPSTDSVLVEVFDLPVINITNDTTLCQGQPLPLGNMEVQEDVTYTWTGPETIEDPNVANAIAFPQANGVYTLVASRGDCQNVDSLEVTITEIFLDILGADTIEICAGTEVPLTAISAPTDVDVTWTPNDGSLNSNVGNSVIATPMEPTSYIATVEVPGCIEMDTVTILVDSLPYNLDILPQDTMICQGEIVVLETPTYEPSDFPNIELLWDPTIGAQSPDSLLNFVVTPDTTVTYRRIATNGLCSDTSFATVNVAPNIILTIEPADTTVCEGSSVLFNVSTENPADLAALEEIMWEPSESLSCMDCLTPTATPTSSTTYSLSAEFMGCPTGATASINVVGLPVVNMNADPIICPGESVQLNLASDNNSEYVWSSPDDPDFSSNEPELMVSPSVNMTYVLVATNVCGSIEESITVTLVGEASLGAIEDFAICEGDETTLTAVGSAENAVTETYQWSWPGGSASGPTFNTSELSQTSTVTLSYTYGSAGQACGVLEETFTVTVSPSPGLTIPDPAEICFGESIVLNLDPDDNTTYNWSSPDDPTFSSTDSAPEVSPNQTTTYSVTAETPGCPIEEVDFTVVVVPAVTMTLPQNIILCQGESIVIEPETNPEGNFSEAFEWFENGTLESVGSVYEFNSDVSGQVLLNYTYGPDCGTVTDSTFVTVQESVNIDTVIVDSVAFANPDTISITRGQGAVVNLQALFDLITGATVAWSENGVPFAGETDATLVYQVINDTQLSVTVTTSAGCTSTVIINITSVEPKLDMPNAFTPDADGDNDFFNYVSMGDFREVVEFKVFNRWGQLVYDNDTPDTGWDGTFNGKDQASDVYIYTITVEQFDNVQVNQKGDVTLIR